LYAGAVVCRKKTLSRQIDEHALLGNKQIQKPWHFGLIPGISLTCPEKIPKKKRRFHF